MKNNRVTNQKGFTLVELIVVITIVGILAFLLVPAMMGYVKKANRRADIANARIIADAVELVIMDDPEAETSFFRYRGDNMGPTNINDSRCQVEQDGVRYTVWVVAKLDGNDHNKAGGSLRGKAFQKGQAENTAFVDAMNENKHLIQGAGGYKGIIAPIKSSEYKGKKTDRWYITYVYNENGPEKCGRVEIWVGDSSGKWGNGLNYRLFPDPPADY